MVSSSAAAKFDVALLELLFWPEDEPDMPNKTNATTRSAPYTAAVISHFLLRMRNPG
jgi:hypothetical protein